MNAPILKTREEIEAMRPAGRLVASALKMIEEMVAPGVSTLEIDRAVEDLFVRSGGIPAFKGYPSAAPGGADFPASICASVNEVVVHGIPDERPLVEGEIISIDVGVELNGWFGDAARTFPVGTVSRKAAKLIQVTRECLERAVGVLRPGIPLKRLSSAIQDQAEKAGYSVVRKYVGHGIGRRMHEPPQIPNYVSRAFGSPELALGEGAVLAIEPMVNIGTANVLVKDDDWTVYTKDHALSAHFEDTVAIGPDGPIVLTAL